MRRPDIAGWSSLVARRAHNPEAVGSNPAPATKCSSHLRVAFLLPYPITTRAASSLEYDKGRRIFEDELIQDSSIDDIDHDVLDPYKSLLGTESSDEQVLKSRRFMLDGKLTVAGALLFAQDPSVMMPQARVRVLRYDGVRMETGKRLNITKERTFCGPLPKSSKMCTCLSQACCESFNF